MLQNDTFVQKIAEKIRYLRGDAFVDYPLIEYYFRNIFLGKSYTKWWRNYSQTLSKLWKLSISLDPYSKLTYILFLLFAKLRTMKIDWNWAADHLLLIYVKLFKKTKKRSVFTLPASFSAWFLKIYKYIYFCWYSISSQMSDYLYFVRYWGICVLTRLYGHKFWN